MGTLVYTDGAAVDGATTWTSAREATLKSDITGVINGSIDAANIANGAITQATMAAGNKLATQAFTINMADELVMTTRIGFSQAHTSSKEFYGGTAKIAMTLVAVDFTADTVDSNNCTMQVAKAGTGIGTASTLTASTSPQTVEQDGLTLSFADGERIGVLVTGVTGTTNVVGAQATLYFTRALA